MINKKRLTDLFKTLANINSPSKEEAEIISYLKNILTDMGFICHEDNASQLTGGNANNLYGILKGNPNLKSICFNAHTDTVMPTKGIKIIEQDNIIKTDGKTVLGADDKAGIALSIEAIKSIIEDNCEHGDIYVLFTVQEEIGVGCASCVDTANFKPDYCFSFDDGLPVISLISAAPTHYTMEYTIHGKSSHAAHSENSINAISVASKAISKIKVGKIDDETCCNIGLIKGGEKTNIVPDLCIVNIEARSLDNNKVTEIVHNITKIFEEECEKEGAKLNKIIKCEYKAFNIDTNDPQFILAYNTASKMGEKPEIIKSLGGYDASVFNAKGLKTMVSGIGYEKIHTVNEFINVDLLYKATEFAYKMIQNLGKNK